MTNEICEMTKSTYIYINLRFVQNIVIQTCKIKRPIKNNIRTSIFIDYS